jgi:hypothetical protein
MEALPVGVSTPASSTPRLWTWRRRFGSLEISKVDTRTALMSLSGGEPGSFFGPLTGKSTTFVLDGRQTNLLFASALMRLLSAARSSCAVLDLDAFYSSNSDRIFASMDASTASSTEIRVPRPGLDVESEFSRLFDARQKVVVIDSLNSLYHLVSLEDGSSRSRKLSFALAGLSYLARTNEKAVVLSMYRREGAYRAGTGRSISTLSEATAAVAIRDGRLDMTVERGAVWPGGVFSIRIPSG